MSRLCMAAMGLFAVVIANVSPPAHAGQPWCRGALEAGRWVNVAPEGQEIAELKLVFDLCWPNTGTHDETQVIDNHGAPWVVHLHGVPWLVEAIGECGGPECSWGTASAIHIDRRRNGYVDSIYGRSWLSPIFTTFVRGDVMKYLYIQLSPNEKDILEVRVFTDYPDGEKPDHTENLRFRPIERLLDYGSGGFPTTMPSTRIKS